MTKVIHLDIETYSSVDLSKCGVYKYAESEDFEILLFAYAYNDDPVTILDLTKQRLPTNIVKDILSPKVLKKAHNAAFERICLSSYLKKHYPNFEGSYLSPTSWYCTMIHATMCGLPASLKQVGEALGLSEDKKKLSTGEALIRYFCKPCKPSKVNGGRTRNLPAHAPEKWAQFIEYNRRDVETEMEIERRLNAIIPFSLEELNLYHLDQRMNDEGIGIDLDLVKKIVDFSAPRNDRLRQEAFELARINVSSVGQIKNWIKTQTGDHLDKLTKDNLQELIDTQTDKSVQRILEYRQELGKTSCKKYQSIQAMTCADGRVHGCLQFYGSRTGRWAGRLLQPQNLPSSTIPDLDQARALVKDKDWELLDLCYPSLNGVFSSLIRTAIVPKEGYSLAVADYAAIEARVIAWLADETWRIQAFHEGKDIYCASASSMFGVPVEKNGINGELRKKGKVAELACIAEGQRVLTDRGLVPIEKVTSEMKLWDGEEWVNHGGVIYRGKKKVIEWQGLIATPDHLVYVEGQDNPIYFGESAKIGSHYTVSGNGGRAVRIRGNNQSRKEMDKKREAQLEFGLCSSEMSNLWGGEMDQSRESNSRHFERMPAMQSAINSSKMVDQEIYSCQAEMHQPQGQKLQELWSKRDRVPIPVSGGSLRVHAENLWNARSEYGVGSDRCERPLRTGESTMGHSSRELPEPKKVFDILNAGPRHRYTVEGHLVHNCGYNGGKGALLKFGADKLGLTETEMTDIVAKWRKNSPNICRLWKTFEKAAELTLKGISKEGPKGMVFERVSGDLKVKLPSGRYLIYHDFDYRYEKLKDKDSLSFKGVNQQTRKWGIIFTYGGKMTENVVQAIARDCLAVAIERLVQRGYRPILLVHDEVIIEVPSEDKEKHLKVIEDIMAEPIEWAKGLELKAAGFTADYYQKD